MIISNDLKRHFCKLYNIPINIFKEPYFTDRLNLYDEFYKTLSKWDLFVSELNKDRYETEQDYFEEYNNLQDEVIYYIKSTDAFKNFQEEDMNEYFIMHSDLPGKDIYQSHNCGKSFISIDMKHANFSSLRFENASMFDHAKTWEEFVRKFTDNEHIVNSKHFRQVVFGNCNPSRQVKFEKYLMGMILDILLVKNANTLSIDRIVSFTNDEIVIDVSDMDDVNKVLLLSAIKSTLPHKTIPLKAELFSLTKITGTRGYCKVIYGDKRANRVEFKCLDSLYLPFVIRHWNCADITESDRMFYHNGLLARFEEIPEISFF